jgi:hypothetical protein
MTINEALIKIGDLLKAEMGRTIQQQTSGTGALENSITYQVKDTPEGTQLIRTMDKYGDYLDSGVKGTERSYASNPKSIWGQGQFKSKAISPKSGLKWPVRIAIAQNGLRPKPFIGSSISSTMDNQGLELLLEAGVQTVSVAIGRELTNITIS